MVQKAPKFKIKCGKTAKEYIMLTQAELNFYEYSTPALLELVKEVKKIREAVEKCTERPVPSIPETPVKDEHPNDSPFDCLAVTKVQVYPFKDGANLGRMKGVAQVILNDQLVINGLRIYDGENGLYVGYPPDPFYKGEDLRSQCYPITRQLREHIQNCVLEMAREKYNII